MIQKSSRSVLWFDQIIGSCGSNSSDLRKSLKNSGDPRSTVAYSIGEIYCNCVVALLSKDVGPVTKPIAVGLMGTFRATDWIVRDCMTFGHSERVIVRWWGNVRFLLLKIFDPMEWRTSRTESYLAWSMLFLSSIAASITETAGHSDFDG